MPDLWEIKLLLGSSHLSLDLFCEVNGVLLDALADLEADEGGYLSLVGLQECADLLLAVLYEDLAIEGNLSAELAHAAVNDLVDDGLRLPLVLRKLCVLLELELGLDLALLLENLCGNIGGPQELG